MKRIILLFSILLVKTHFLIADNKIVDLKKQIQTKQIDSNSTIVNLKIALSLSENNPSESEKFLNKAQIHALKSNNKKDLTRIYLAYIDLYEKQKKYKEAFQYETLYISIHDSLINENMISVVTEAEEQYNKVKHQLEIESLKKSNILHQLEIEDIKHHKTMNYVFVLAFIVLVVILLLIFRSNKQKKETNIILKLKNKEIVHQKRLLEIKNKDVIDSIEYAKKIQFSILPETALFDAYFSDYFILYKPKDIVSGDFYWAKKVNEKLFFAVIDCTGHGVPGAFLSILAYNGLNKITSKNKDLHPAQILDRLHFHIRNLQNKNYGEFKEGMDISLCSFDLKNNVLEFAGALNPIFLNLDGTFIELPANRRSIASSLQNKKNYYNNYTVKLEKGNSFYLFTDGFQDQFGGEKGKKITKSRLKSTLMELQSENLSIQKEKLDLFFTTWQGTEKQVDDVCLIGIKI